MALIESLIAAHREGRHAGLYSVCCSNAQVLLAAMDVAREYDTPLLVEATSNQVDQFGGYTGMTPERFRDYAQALAAEKGFPNERLVLGGDHLGPNAWQRGPAELAMANARDLVAAYVAAGFSKIHLDCSMSCADDPPRLSDEVVAERAASLARVAERTASQAGLPPPVYVIGTEVPVPGGEASLGGGVAVTRADAAAQTLEIHRRAFDAPDLAGAWQRVIAMVVQPGVDFDNSSVQRYEPDAAAALSHWLEQQPRIVFEAHSTDYQSEPSLRALVRDHFAILKVGPAATFAYREALFALAGIEDALFPPGGRSRLVEVLDAAMRANPTYWKHHYAGDERELHLLRAFAYSDRCRYYWGDASVQTAVDTLVANLRERVPPETLLSQYLPQQYEALLEGRVSNDPLALVRHRIGVCLATYARACSHDGGKVADSPSAPTLQH